MARRRLRHGLTTLETICVVVIIAVLVALMSPVVMKARESALRAEATGRLQSLYFAVQQYRADYDGLEAHGGAAVMGFPDSLAVYNLTRPAELFHTDPARWSSPCGQHPDTPPLDRAGTNLGYYPTDVAGEPWSTYSIRKGDAAVFLDDENCNPKNVPLSAMYFPILHIGLTVGGTVRRRTTTNGTVDFITWNTEQ